MDLRTSVSTEAGGAKQADMALLPVHIAIAIDPQSISPDGDLEFLWRVTAASVPAGSGPPSPVADGLRAEVATVAQRKGRARVSARGLSLDVSMEDPDSGVDAGLTGQMVEQVRQAVRDVAAPLPVEPVGAGARWQRVMQLEEKKARIVQTETFTLVALDGSKGTLDDVLAQTAPPQPLHGAGTGDTLARMDSMLASGDSKVRFDLSRLVPQSLFDGTTTMVLSGASAGDASQRLTMIMHVSIAIQGTTR